MAATDNFALSKPSEPIVQALTDAGVAIGLNSLVYHDGTYAQPAGAQADQGSEATNQALFAARFLGISNTVRTGSESADGNISVQTEVDLYVPCTSSTFALGDMVAAVETGSGDALENFKVKKTTDPALAIGRVTKEETSAATKVWVRFRSRVLPPAAAAGTFSISVPVIPHASLTEQNLFVANESVQIIGIDVVPDVAQGGTLTGTICKVSGTATPVKTSTPMHTADGVNFNGTAHTVQAITLTATAADLKLVAGDRIGLDLSAALSTGRANVTIRMRRLN